MRTEFLSKQLPALLFPINTELLRHKSIIDGIVQVPVQRLKRIQTYHPEHRNQSELSRNDLIFFNGYGGFTPDGREYIITTSDNQVTPAPWINVMANPDFGTVVSESGPTYTWSENAHEFRLTPWNDDPVTDSSGEAFYIRDEETGHFWSPTPLPSRGAGSYISRHGFGYSVFEHTEDGIRSELWIYVATDASVKFSVLKIKNQSGKPRRLSATGYVELVLGDLRPKSVMHVISEIDKSSGGSMREIHIIRSSPTGLSFFKQTMRLIH